MRSGSAEGESRGIGKDKKVAKSAFMPPAEWPDTQTENDLGELAERAEALRPRSLQGQAIVAEVVEMLWLAQQTEIASRLAVWRSHGYRPAFAKGASQPAMLAAGRNSTSRVGDAK